MSDSPIESTKADHEIARLRSQFASAGYDMKKMTRPESTKELHESKERKPEMKWEDGKIFAPWTPEQVEALNAYQKGPMHPFTCGNDDRDAHRREGFDSWQEFEARRTLVATEAGWICPSCDYTQDWAHDFMGRVGLSRGAEPAKCPTCSAPVIVTRGHDNGLQGAEKIASPDTIRYAPPRGEAETPTDTERMDWLAANYFGVDFEYGDHDNPVMALVIRIPEGEGVRVTSDFISTIDALRKLGARNAD